MSNESIGILSFSAEFCGPCKMMRSYVLDTYGADKANYTWVNVEDMDSASDNVKKIFNEVKVRSIPSVAIVDFDNGNVIDKWVGFSKGKIDDYVRKYKS